MRKISNVRARLVTLKRLLLAFFRPDLRHAVNQLFALRNLFFSRKKETDSKNYPYDLIDPYLVFGEEMVKCAFSLVGQNWLDAESKRPVALLWGFNQWKWGFVKDYLPEYRTAFAPRKISWPRAFRAFFKLPIKPKVFVIWSYTEPKWIAILAWLHRIKIYRMEDGFIRSSMLGATHATPYSLVLDSCGLYYDANQPSDIENILNVADFSASDLIAASECLDILKNLELSKYNPPRTLSSKPLGIKIKRRVAVLGQVDNDMSIRLGNPQRWSMIELVKLAKLEHPDAEILYRPHPEVYLGYQQSRFKRRKIDSVCTVVSPESLLTDFLETIDHVYTITSLSGLEALLRGITVTVVGTPFYAGWGLTDDRVELPQRTAKLTLLQLFAGIYLKYPRYLADLERPEVGFRAAALRIVADRQINGCLAAKEIVNEVVKETDNKKIKLNQIIQSPYWPQLLFAKPGPVSEDIEKIIPTINSEYFLNNAPGKLFQYTFLLAICGKITDISIRDAFLSNVRHYIDAEIYNNVLLLLHKYSSGLYVYEQLSWLLGESDELAIAENIFQEALRLEERRIEEVVAKERSEEHSDDTNNNNAEDSSNVESPQMLNLEQQQIFRNLYDVYYEERKIDLAIQVAGILMISGCADHAMLLSMANIAELQFDNRSTYDLVNFCQHIDMQAMNSRSSFIKVEALEINIKDENALLDYLSEMVLHITLRPDQIERIFLLLKKYEDFLNLEETQDILLRTLYLDNKLTNLKALGFKSIGENDRAIQVIESVIASGNNSDSAIYAYSQSLSYADRINDALSVVLHAIKNHDSLTLYGEAIRLLVINGDFARADTLVKQAELKKLLISEMLRRKTFFGCRRIKDAMLEFKELAIRKNFYTYYRDKYYNIDESVTHQDNILILAFFGPGDEILFASMYHSIKNVLPHRNLTISCDPRLLDMMSRAFPEFNFIPVARPQTHELINKENYNLVPGSDLITILDNNGVQAIERADQVILLPDLLHICFPDYNHFNNKPYLYAKPDLVEKFRQYLPKGRLLVGLSWRSSLITHSRNIHYLTIEELDKIFKIDGIQYINFQYDECSKELAWVEQRYPGKLIHFDTIDHYNDFESVAALMMSMDLIVSPFTAVGALSGALDCPTWLLSNSAETRWRRIDINGKDAFYRRARHIEGSVLGDKSTLVEKLYSSLIEFGQEGRDAICSTPM